MLSWQACHAAVYLLTVIAIKSNAQPSDFSCRTTSMTTVQQHSQSGQASTELDDMKKITSIETTHSTPIKGEVTVGKSQLFECLTQY